MWVFLFTLYLSFIHVDMASDASQEATQVLVASNARNLGTSMLAVHNALSAYITANPTATGSIALSALGLPTWMYLDTRIQAVIYAGQGFVYFPPSAFSLSGRPSIDDMFTDNATSGLVGIAHSNQLVSAGLGVTNPLPAVIPENSIVVTD